MADNFNPFAEGATSTMTAPGPAPAAQDGFDPFKEGAKPADTGTTSPPFYLARHPDPETRWKDLYGGLEGLNARVEGAEASSFDALDRVSKDPKEDRARAINQAFIAEKTNMPGQYLSRNWDATKLAYAKQEMGIDVPMMSDEALYGHIASRIGAKGEPQDLEGIGEIKAWTWKDTLSSDYSQMQKNVATFMDSISKPFVELSKSMPFEEHGLPDIPFLGAYNPAVAKGTFMDLTRALAKSERGALDPIYEGGTKPAIEGFESPLGVATLGIGGELNAASKAGNVLAKRALMGMESGFTAWMAQSAAAQTPDWWKMMRDPNTPLADKVKSSASLVTSSAFATMGGLAVAFDLMEPSEAEKLASSLEGKKPSEAAEEMRQTAATSSPEAANQLNRMAAEMDDLAQHEAGVANWETDGGGLTAGGQEKIKAAAIRTSDGQIATGPAHQAIAAELTQGELDFEGEAKTPEGAQEGFVTNTGRFVSREEASVIAQNAGQLAPEHAAEPPKELHSHMVEFDRPRSTVGQTSLRNAYGDLERVAYGFEEAPATERRDMAEQWARSGEILKKRPEVAAEVAQKLIENPNMGLRDDQSAILLRYKVGLQTALNEASDIAYDRQQSAELREEAGSEVKELSEKLHNLLEAIHARGSEWGREGRWRQALAKEDYSFASQENLLRAAKGGAELTEPERAALVAQIDALKAKQADYDARIAELTAKSREQTTDEVVKAMSKPPRAPRPFRRAEATRSSLHTRADEARARLLERLQRVNDITQVIADSPAVLKDMAIIGADKIYSVGLDFAKWSTEMIADLGEKIRPALNQMWEASQDLFHTENRAGLVKELQDKDTEARQKALSPIAQEMARSFIEQGARGRDEVVDKVHAELQKAMPDITKREAQDAISGYGQFKPLTHDQITDELRDIKGQLQQVSKLQDMAAGQAPKKTGMERRAPSDEERRLQQQVEEEKKKGGYAVTDPEKQLRTALQAQERNLSNRIKDLAKELETGQPRAAGLPPPTSPEIEALKILRDRISETVKSAQSERETPPEVRIKRAVEATTKATERLEADLNDGKVFPDSSKRSSPWSPELARKRRYAAELKAFRKEMQDFEKPPKTPQQRAIDTVDRNLKKQISQLESAISKKEEIAKKTPSKVTSPDIEALRARRDELKKQYEGIFGRKEMTNDQRLNIWSAYANRRLIELQDMMDRGDYAAKPKRAPLVHDKATESLRNDLERMKQDFAIERARAEDALKPKTEKTTRGLAEIARGLVLSGYHILGKLASFSVWAYVKTPVLEGVGAVLERLPGFQEIREQANLEAGAQYEGLAKFYTESAKKGFQDAWDTFTTRKSDLDVELGDFKINTRVPKWYDYFDGGLWHKSEKAILKRADYSLRLEKRQQWALANGLWDGKDEMINAAMRKEAYDYAQRAILQENNVLAKAVNAAERVAMQKLEGFPVVQQQMIAMKYLFDAIVTKGIVKTPLNFIDQAIDASPAAFAKIGAYSAFKRIMGVTGYTPQEANIIMRLWKVGAVGSAFFVWGMIDATKDPKDRMFGGFYQPGDKRGNDDVMWGRVRLGNTQLPAWITEAPAISAQMGNTFMRVAMSKKPKGEGATKGYTAATIHTIASIAGSAPIANPLTSDSKLIEAGEGEKILWEAVASWMPGFTSDLARDIDGKSRKADTFIDTMKLGIPGLREDVPETKAQKRRDVQQSQLPK